ncbi:hypothetical protein M426DRAFT_25046 [Hypoxylon sp. CI-4A]|nr:hypothetical protein M426DRAFT_25046 [Hypoxylon sp. CI-4A]
MSHGEHMRPTPQSLPRLVIPTYSYKPEPEEITASRVESFLEYCKQHKRAPLTRLPTAPLILPPPEPEFEEDPEKIDSEARKERKPSYPIPDLPPDTLAFTENEGDVLEDLVARCAEAETNHTDWILELRFNPKDREVLDKCRHWRQVRERLNLEKELVWKKREIRRNFRKDSNHIPGLTNW